MIASSWMDPVLGLDMHWELVPVPPGAPVPSPFPHLYTGIVVDLGGLAGSLVMGAAMSAVFGAQFKGPVIHWFTPATNTGTNSKHIPGHILIPPGMMWAPVPRTPKPKIRPNEVVVPAPPIKPEDDATSILGSKTVEIGGSNGVRLGDLFMSCSEPVRLPSSVVLPIPKGPLILIGGPPALDLASAFLASLKTRFVSDSLHALVSRLAPGRFRNLLDRVICFFTGHPVDVASGKVMTWSVDVELPGPLPLRIERVYSSAFGEREGSLGHGWSLSLDQAIWTERGKVVLLAEDGREIEFDAFDLPDHRMRPGDRLWHPIDRLELECLDGGKWRVTEADGRTREFGPVSGRKDGRAMIQRIRSRCRTHEISFRYDAAGKLERVRDAGGRQVLLERDERGRVVTLSLPRPDEDGFSVHRAYAYDAKGDLVQVTDALGHSWRFEYVTHLLVRETDRTGLSFHFDYDGLGQDAWCTRTWGDGGIYDHKLAYDKVKKVTFVTDSLGRTTQYHMNLVGLVVKVVDPLQSITQYEYDPRTLQKVKQTDPLGNAFTWRHDDRGRETEITGPDGGRLLLVQGASGLERATDAGGGEWTWTRDRQGLVTTVRTPGGEQIDVSYARGLPIRVRSRGPREVYADYDSQLDLILLQAENGAETRYERDRLGRIRQVEDACGGVARLEYDAEGRTVRVRTPSGAVEELSWNAEGDLVAFQDATHRVRYGIGHMHRVLEREEAGATQRLEFDTEGRLAAVINEAGERCELHRDEAGRIVRQVGFDGVAQVYQLDRAGRVTEVQWPSGRRSSMAYDPSGRRLRTTYSDGASVQLEYDRTGAMVAARTATSSVELVRDPMQRPLEEKQQIGADLFTVSSRYGPDGLRSGVTSSLGAAVAWARGPFGAVTDLFIGLEATAQRAGATLPRLEARFDQDLLGRTLGVHWSSGLHVDWVRDPAGRPVKRRTQFDGRSAEQWECVWEGQARMSLAAQAPGGVTAWQHDARRRLVGVVDADGVRHPRALDATGNVYLRDDLSDRRYGRGNRLETVDGTTFEYDLDGRIVARRGAAGDWRYRWNGAGMLEQVDGPDGRRVRFEYDAFARRVRKTAWSRWDAGAEPEDETRYVWDGNRLLHESSTRRGLVTWYWDADGLTPIARETGGKRWTIACDHLGTPTAMYDGQGAVAWKARLGPTGLLAVQVGAPEDCPWRWPGQYEDRETGLFYNRHRYYDPMLGRYLSPDPSGLAGGLNAYAYVEDPLVQVDPFGLHVVEAFLNGIAVVNPKARAHPTWWRNLTGSVENGMAASGYGRLNDSENRLMEYLRESMGKDNLKGKTLEIHSLGEPGMGWGPIEPCLHCDPGMQNFANEMEMTVIYHGPEGKEPHKYEPCKK